MTDNAPKKAGKATPKPIVMRKHMDGRLPAGAGQKRSLAVSLALMGALTLGAYEFTDWLDKKLNCEPDPNNPDELICKHRSSSSGWHWSSGGSSSSSSHGFSFGGFGHSGGFHFGGG